MTNKFNSTEQSNGFWTCLAKWDLGKQLLQGCLRVISNTLQAYPRPHLVLQGIALFLTLPIWFPTPAYQQQSASAPTPAECCSTCSQPPTIEHISRSVGTLPSDPSALEGSEDGQKTGGANKESGKGSEEQWSQAPLLLAHVIQLGPCTNTCYPVGPM